MNRHKYFRFASQNADGPLSYWIAKTVIINLSQCLKLFEAGLHSLSYKYKRIYIHTAQNSIILKLMFLSATGNHVYGSNLKHSFIWNPLNITMTIWTEYIPLIPAINEIWGFVLGLVWFVFLVVVVWVWFLILFLVVGFGGGCFGFCCFGVWGFFGLGFCWVWLVGFLFWVGLVFFTFWNKLSVSVVLPA